MTGAMYSGIAGLRTHMQDLNVIGNNIANVNTKGYKSGRSVFRSALYTSISSGREGTAVVGSKNPSQLGYGSNLTTVDVDMSTASYAPGKSTDLMIDGDGFFLIGDKETANIIDPKDPSTFKSFNLTRVGDVEFKSDGYLCNGQGDVVYGFLCIGTVDGKEIYSDQLVPIRAPRQDDNNNVMWPHYEMVTEDGEEGGDDGDGKLTLVDTLQPTDEDGAAADDEVENDYVKAQLSNITIGETGKITATVRATGQQITIGVIALGTVDNPNGVTQLSNTYYKCDQGAGDLYVNVIGGMSKEMIIANNNLPAEGDEDSDTEVQLPTSTVPSVTLGNGTVLTQGLEYVNGSQVNAADDAGEGEDLDLPYNAQVFDTGSSTVLVPGGLETSKTDLATEIANMITTQRGYQANTRIITVTDSMLEELVNMKR